MTDKNVRHIDNFSARIKYKKYCSHCGKEVGTVDIIKGYEYEKGKYETMTDEELERLKTNKDKDNPFGTVFENERDRLYIL